MSSYIKSEFYRIFHYKWTYLFIAICSALLVSSNVLLAVLRYSDASFSYGNTAFAFANFISNVVFVFILCISVASMIFGNEHTNHTMKNSVSYGITRGKIYFSKLIIEIVYALIAFVIITGFFIASAYLLLEHSHENEIMELLKMFAASLPLLLFALATTNCFIFIIEGTGASIAAITGLLIALPLVSNFLGMKFEIFRRLAKVLPWNMISSIGIEMKPYSIVLPWAGNAGYYNCWLAGILQMIIIIIIGYLVFRKREIK